MEEEASEFFYPSSTPPKLTLDSFTSFPRRVECPGMATPPIRLPGAIPMIPFKWEEAPGRPMQKPNQQHSTSLASATADADRHLGLPPRLSASAAIKEERGCTKILSPPPVVDGPFFFIRRPLSFTFERLPFGKKRKGLKKVRWDVNSDKSSTEETPNSSSFNSSSIGSLCSYSNGEGGSEGEEEQSEEWKEEEERMVRILRYKRKRTLTCVTSQAASQLWASIFGRLKQAVAPCKRNPKS